MHLSCNDKNGACLEGGGAQDDKIKLGARQPVGNLLLRKKALKPKHKT